MASIPEFGQALSPRESDVLAAFCDDCYTAKDVARKLGISHRTVAIHVGNAIAKMGARNQQHAVLMWDRAARGPMVDTASAEDARVVAKWRGQFVPARNAAAGVAVGAAAQLGPPTAADEWRAPDGVPPSPIQEVAPAQAESGEAK